MKIIKYFLFCKIFVLHFSLFVSDEELETHFQSEKNELHDMPENNLPEKQATQQIRMPTSFVMNEPFFFQKDDYRLQGDCTTF